MPNERQERIRLLALKKLAGVLSDAEAGELRALCAEDDRLRRLADALLSEQLLASAARDRNREACRRSWQELQRTVRRQTNTGWKQYRRWGYYAAAAAFVGVVAGWLGLQKPLAVPGMEPGMLTEAVLYVDGLDGPQTVHDVYDFRTIRQELLRRMGDRLEAMTTGQYTRVCVPEGKCYKVRLNDGTWVYLEGGAYLSVPGNYSESNRCINLVGTAHVAVSEGTKPLCIYTGSGDVYAYEGCVDIRGGGGSGAVEVSVDGGRAEVVSSREHQFLTEQGRALVTGEGDVSLHPGADQMHVGFWQNRQLDEMSLAYTDWKFF